MCLVMSFVSRSVFLRILGVGYLGINGLFNDLLSMLNMAELGFGTAMTFGMYKPLAENDTETITALTNFYKRVYHTIALTILIIGMALLPFLPYLVNLEEDIPHIEIYYILFLVSNVASYFATFRTVVLYADQKNYIMLQRGAVWHIAEVGTMLVVLCLTKNYLLYLITQVIFVYARNIYMSRLSMKHYPYLKGSAKLPKERKHGIFKDVGSAFLYKLANVMISGTDNALISVLINTETVGFYSNYQIITAKVGGIVGTVFSSTITSLGNLLAKDDEEKRYKIFQTMQSLCFMLSTFFVSCIFLLEEDFIRVWLGNEYVLGTMSLCAIVFNFYFSILTTPVVTYREAAGLFRKTKFIMLWTAFFNLVLSFVWGKYIGLSGIIFATSASKILTSFWYEPKLLFREYFHKNPLVYFADILKSVVITAVTVCVTWLATHFFVPDGWLQLFLKGVLVAIISFVVVILMYGRTDGAKMLFDKFKMLIRRKEH